MNMAALTRRAFVAISATMCMFLFSSCNSSAKSVPATWQWVESKDGQFHIAHPPGWDNITQGYQSRTGNKDIVVALEIRSNKQPRSDFMLSLMRFPEKYSARFSKDNAGAKRWMTVVSEGMKSKEPNAITTDLSAKKLPNGTELYYIIDNRSVFYGRFHWKGNLYSLVCTTPLTSITLKYPQAKINLRDEDAYTMFEFIFAMVGSIR